VRGGGYTREQGLGEMIFEVKHDILGVGGEGVWAKPWEPPCDWRLRLWPILSATRLPVSFRAVHHLPPYDGCDNLSR
jgi:hypothetical protein